MGREKTRKPRRDKRNYLTVMVDDEPVTVSVPPEVHKITSKRALEEITDTARYWRALGNPDRVIPVGHRTFR